MVKEKKLTKSSIAIIVLALLLVASLIMGMTGAWFTQQDKSSNTPAQLQFGHITAADLVGAGSAVATTSDVRAVPGDSVTLSAVGIHYTANVDTYLFIKTNFAVEVKFPEDEGFTVAGEALIDELFGSGTYARLQALVNMAQDTEDANYKAPAKDGALTNSGDTAGYHYYLYEEAAESSADYHVDFAGSANQTLTIASTVTNQGENVDATDTNSAHNWTDVQVKVSYQVIARVIQANHTATGETDLAKAEAAFAQLPALA